MTKFIKLKVSDEFDEWEEWFSVNHIVKFYEWKGLNRKWYVTMNMTNGENYQIVGRENEIIHQIRTAV